MALIKCPECNKEVSDKAETCPHCGIRLKEEKLDKETDILNKQASQIICRNHLWYHAIGVVCGIILIIVSIVIFIINANSMNKYANDSSVSSFTTGVITLLSGILLIIYCSYRLKTY